MKIGWDVQYEGIEEPWRQLKVDDCTRSPEVCAERQDILGAVDKEESNSQFLTEKHSEGSCTFLTTRSGR
jgi:hypothetical protein